MLAQTTRYLVAYKLRHYQPGKMSAKFNADDVTATGQKLTSFEFDPGSPLGSPATTPKRHAFCARQGIAPTIEKFPQSQVNEGLEHLGAGKVLGNDIG